MISFDELHIRFYLAFPPKIEMAMNLDTDEFIKINYSAMRYIILPCGMKCYNTKTLLEVLNIQS